MRQRLPSRRRTPPRASTPSYNCEQKVRTVLRNTARSVRLSNNLPSQKSRREGSCERKPSGFPFAFHHPPRRQNCKIILQNFILQFCKQLVKKSPERLFDKMTGETAACLRFLPFFIFCDGHHRENKKSVMKRCEKRAIPRGPGKHFPEDECNGAILPEESFQQSSSRSSQLTPSALASSATS